MPRCGITAPEYSATHVDDIDAAASILMKEVGDDSSGAHRRRWEDSETSLPHIRWEFVAADRCSKCDAAHLVRMSCQYGKGRGVTVVDAVPPLVLMRRVAHPLLSGTPVAPERTLSPHAGPPPCADVSMRP